MPSNTDSVTAIQDITDAIRATTAFLSPPDIQQYVKLGFLIVFLGGVGGIGPVQLLTGIGNVDTDNPVMDEPGSNTASFSDMLTTLDNSELSLIIGVVVVILLCFIGLLAVGSVFEFIFVEVLRQERIKIRAYWRQWWRQGLRLLGFRLVVGALTVIPIAVIALTVVTPLITSGNSPSFGVVIFALGICVTTIMLSGLLTGLTKTFVVPVMIIQDETLLAAWQRFWPTVRSEWKEYSIYLIIRFVLQLIIGIATGLILTLATIIFAIPAIVILAAGILLGEATGIIGIILIIGAIFVFVFGILSTAILAAVPIQIFLRYYALFVLGDTNSRFDLITDRRMSVRKL